MNLNRTQMANILAVLITTHENLRFILQKHFKQRFTIQEFFQPHHNGISFKLHAIIIFICIIYVNIFSKTL